MDRTHPLNVAALRRPEALGAALRAAGYTQAALLETMRALGFSQRLDLPAVACRVSGCTPFNVLARLFLLGRAVDPGELALALPAALQAELAEAGVLTSGASGVAARVKLMPHEQLYVIADFGAEITGEHCPADHVLGVGAASMTLAGLTVRRPCARALDVGTGAGIQCLLAAGHCQEVVGTDTNARALNYAAFNARLNGFSHITLRQGSFFEPVADETFDLVVSNPPFVISPESRYIFRDGGLGGDAVSEAVARTAGSRLTEGGYGVVLVNWHHASTDDWDERPRAWVTGNGCDSWLLCFDDEDPVTYAARWLAPLAETPEGHARALQEWLAYYEASGIRRICAGALVLRRVTGRGNFFRADRIEGGKHVEQCGDQIARIMEAEAFLRTHPADADWLDQTLTACPGLWVEHGLQLADGTWNLQASRLRQTQGFGFSGQADAVVLMLLARCTGASPLRAVFAGLRAEMGADAPETTEFANLSRRLVRVGHLLPADVVAPGRAT